VSKKNILRGSCHLNPSPVDSILDVVYLGDVSRAPFISSPNLPSLSLLTSPFVGILLEGWRRVASRALVYPKPSFVGKLTSGSRRVASRASVAVAAVVAIAVSTR